MHMYFFIIYLFIYLICSNSCTSNFKALPSFLLPGHILLCHSCSWKSVHSQVPLPNFLHGQPRPPKSLAAEGLHVDSPVLDTISPTAGYIHRLHSMTH